MRSRRRLAGCAIVAACAVGALPAWGQSGLEAALEAREDFSGVGSIAVLNNGLIVVSTGGAVYTDEHGELVYEPFETIVLQTPGEQPANDELFVILKFADADFDLEWGDNVTLTAVIETPSATQLNRFVLLHPDRRADRRDGRQGPWAASAQCGAEGRYACNALCPPGRTCLAYCDGIEPACNCVNDPRPEP